MSRYFLGIDAGGTKTHALVANESGRAIGIGVGGPGNWQVVGYEGQKKVLFEVTRQALKVAGIDAREIEGAGLGLAGYDWPSQLEMHRKSVEPLQLECNYEMVNDATIALVAGVTEGWGVGLVAGTGNNVRGRDRDGREGRITGEGIRFGEFGGGMDLVMKAVHAVAYEWTRRGPKTVLSKLFMEIAGAKDLSELIEGIDMERYEPNAAWALAVFQAGYSGDPVASDVIEWSGRELGESACAVIRQLELEEEEVEVVMAGSLFLGGELYTRPLQEMVWKTAPKAKFVRLEVPPVIGGVLLGMEHAFGPEAYTARQKLIETVKTMIDTDEA